MKQELTLFYRPGACALAPHILLYWLGRDHEVVNAPRDETYRRINPSGAVPAIKFGNDRVLTQCSAILNYLAEDAGRTDLLGGDDIHQRAEVAQWNAFFTGDFHPAFFPVFAPGSYTKQEGIPARESVQSAGLDLIAKHLGTIEKRLSSGSVFVGNAYTIADAYSVPMLRWATTMLPQGLKPWPSTESYYYRICEDEGVLDAMAVHGISA